MSSEYAVPIEIDALKNLIEHSLPDEYLFDVPNEYEVIYINAQDLNEFEYELLKAFRDKLISLIEDGKKHMVRVFFGSSYECIGTERDF